MKTDESLIETIFNSEIVRPYVTLYMEGKTDRKGKRKENEVWSTLCHSIILYSFIVLVSY